MEKRERKVISKSSKRRAIPKGSKMFHFTEQVVYHETNARGRKVSITKHEIAKK